MNKIIVKPKPPYDFGLSLDFLLKDREGPFPEMRRGNVLMRGFKVGNKLGPVKIRSVGGVEKPVLEISTIDLSSKERVELKQKVSHLLNLNEDLKELYDFMEKDEKLREIKEGLYGFKVPRMGLTIYEAIIKTIIQQQISLQVAFRMISEVVKSLEVI